MEQFLGIERFADKKSGSLCESPAFYFIFVVRGNEDDRQLGPRQPDATL